MDIFFASVIGLCLGSFATVLLYRIPRRLPWALEGDEALRSRCPSCHTVLSARDLVPVFSWIVNRGKCRHCAQAISWFYPVIEISAAVLTVAVYMIFKEIWA